MKNDLNMLFSTVSFSQLSTQSTSSTKHTHNFFATLHNICEYGANEMMIIKNIGKNVMEYCIYWYGSFYLVTIYHSYFGIDKLIQFRFILLLYFDIVHL